MKKPFPKDGPRNHCVGCTNIIQGECDILGEITTKAVSRCKISGYKIWQPVHDWSQRHYENKKGAL